jgi:hypothetical protein
LDLAELFHLDVDQKLTGVDHRRPVFDRCAILFAAEAGDLLLKARQLVSGIAVGLCQCTPGNTAQMLIGAQLIHVSGKLFLGALATPNASRSQAEALPASTPDYKLGRAGQEQKASANTTGVFKPGLREQVDR